MIQQVSSLPNIKERFRKKLFLKDKSVPITTVEVFRIQVAMAPIGFVMSNELRNIVELVAGAADGQRVIPLFLTEEVLLREESDLIQNLSLDKHESAC